MGLSEVVNVKEINVMLYGGFDKKSRNRAEIVMCDKCDNCSFYKNKKCLNVASFANRCAFGRVNKVTGYTQRAKARDVFDARYKSDELYGALKEPRDWRVGLIDNVVVFNLTYAICDKKYFNAFEHKWEELEKYRVRENGMFSTGTYSYIPLNDLTSELLDMILSYRPMTLLDNCEIKNYQCKIVPNILFELSRLLPDVYKKLLIDYPKFEEISPNFVGKTAQIKSLMDGIVLKTDKGIFIKNGNYLVSDCWKSAFLPFDNKEAEIKIMITDNMTYKITDNSQVDENTVFV